MYCRWVAAGGELKDCIEAVSTQIFPTCHTMNNITKQSSPILDDDIYVYDPSSFFSSFPLARSVRIKGEKWNDDAFKLLSNMHSLYIGDGVIINVDISSH